MAVMAGGDDDCIDGVVGEHRLDISRRHLEAVFSAGVQARTPLLEATILSRGRRP